MAADDLVLDMIKTHSRYDMPEDLNLSCSDVPEHSDFTGGTRGGPRYVDEADGSLKEADKIDWPKHRNRNVNPERRTCLEAWESDGLKSELKDQDSLGSHFSDQHDQNKQVISQEDPDSKIIGQKHLGSNVLGQEDLGNDMISEDGKIHDICMTTVAHKYKSDGSLSDMGMSVAGEDDWWDGEGHPAGERWPPLGAPDDQEEDGTSYDSW